MKKTQTIILGALLSINCLGSQAQQFQTYKEAKDPVPMSERSIEAWKTVGKLQAQWVSADSLYSRSEVPQKSAVTTCRLEGWRGERVSAQLLLWTGKGVDGVKTK